MYRKNVVKILTHTKVNACTLFRKLFVNLLQTITAVILTAVNLLLSFVDCIFVHPKPL